MCYLIACQWDMIDFVLKLTTGPVLPSEPGIPRLPEAPYRRKKQALTDETSTLPLDGDLYEYSSIHQKKEALVLTLAPRLPAGPVAPSSPVGPLLPSSP